MALINDIELINALLTLKERCKNLRKRGIIPSEMGNKADEVITEQLEIYFPPPPPPE